MTVVTGKKYKIIVVCTFVNISLEIDYQSVPNIKNVQFEETVSLIKVFKKIDYLTTNFNGIQKVLDPDANVKIHIYEEFS